MTEVERSLGLATAAACDDTPVPSDLDLMRLQAATLYRLDERGRILAVNEVTRPPAPRLFLGRTRQGNVWHLRHDLSPELAGELSELLAAEPTAPDLPAEPPGLPALRAALAGHAPLEREWRGPAYLLPPDAGRRLDPAPVEVDAGNAELLRPDFEDLIATLGEWTPCLAVVEDGRAVAVCFCSRRGVRAAEAGVNTSPAHRRRGLASAAAAAWAAAVRRRGMLPLYSTSWQNLASQGVARRLGARLYGEDVSLT